MKYNKSKPSTIELKDFVVKSHQILTTSSVFFESKNIKFFSCLGFDKSACYRTDFETVRFRLPIESLFETRENLLVLGEAGAGKSTSLEIYSQNHKEKDETFILIRLAQAVQLIEFDNLNKTFLINLICNYLNKEFNLKLQQKVFEEYLLERSVVLLLDGLDEAIKVVPELPQIINLFANCYKKVQLIVTTRMHGSYLNIIPFFSITILPFTDEQRNLFISKWFENEDDGIHKCQKLLTHLNENAEISNTVKNPLLVTTLCILANHKISLPKSEVRLYDARLKLFTGYYDTVRDIVLRINSVPENLILLAQKLAFYLHSENKRDETLENLKSKAKIYLSTILDQEEIESAFQDLIHPCEILIPMTSDGKYGFGHLRFQEHLVAREIFNNRNIEIINFINNDWWKGSLKFLILMSENVEWIIKNIGNSGKIESNFIDDLLKLRHSIERKNLNILISSYKQTYFDDFLEDK